MTAVRLRDKVFYHCFLETVSELHKPTFYKQIEKVADQRSSCVIMLRRGQTCRRDLVSDNNIREAQDRHDEQVMYMCTAATAV
jgi:hypothetical protein